MYSILLAIRLSFSNLRANFTRTIITLVGIVVSIAAIIIVVSAGGSVKEFVLGQVTTFGTDLVQVETRTPSGTEGQDYSLSATANIANITTLTLSDMEAIKRLGNVRTASAGAFGQKQVTYEDKRKTTMLYGASPEVTEVDANVKMAEGRFFSVGEDEAAAQVVVLGSAVSETLFGKRTAVGEKVKVGGNGYRVVGVLAERGFLGGLNFDEMAYVPVRTLQKKILGIDHLTFITVKLTDASRGRETAQNIRSLLRHRHNIVDSRYDDFEAMSIEEGLELVSSVFRTINILLLALASISLVVGGVGIMNVMFVALSERLGEIGVRKALGARSGDILKQFLVEALVITFFGGLVGIGIGAATLFGIISLIGSLGIKVAFALTGETIAIAVGFSAAAGLIFGVYPAWKASQVSPTAAMRGE